MTHSLENERLIVRIGADGTLRSLVNKGTGDDFVKFPSSLPLFALSVMKGTYGEKRTLEPAYPIGAELRESGGSHGLALHYRSEDEDAAYEAKVTVDLGRKGSELEWRLELDWSAANASHIVDVVFPNVRGFQIGESGERNALLYPHHAGERTENPAQAYASDKYAGFWRAEAKKADGVYRREINYCGLASMTWMYLQDERQGLYIGQHDERFPVTGLRVETGGANGPWMGFAFVKHSRIRPGERWSSGPAVLAVADEDWHWGARRYRRWIDPFLHVPRHSDRLKRQYILSQCYNFKRGDRIDKRFRDIPGMYAEGRDRFGMEHLFLASWNRKGFDADYPEFQPDMELGTPWELMEGCRRVNESGGFATFYINARIFDKQSDFHPGLGEAWAMRDHAGGAYEETYGPRTFTVCCPSHDEWKRYLIDMSKWMVRSYGATGIYLDQLGSADPYPCFQPEHSHRDTGEFNAGYAEVLKTLYGQLREINPEAFLMIENCGDIYSSYAWGSLTWNGEKYDEYFELLKYTFPEYTQVHMVNPRAGLEGEAMAGQLRKDMARAMRLGAVLWLGLDKLWRLDEASAAFVEQAVRLRARIQSAVEESSFRDREGIAMVSEGAEASMWLKDDGSGGMVVIADSAETGQASVELTGAYSEALRGAERLVRLTLHREEEELVMPGADGAVRLSAAGRITAYVWIAGR